MRIDVYGRHSPIRWPTGPVRIAAVVMLSIGTLAAVRSGHPEGQNRAQPIETFRQGSASDDPVFEPYEYEYEGTRVHAELGRLSVPERHASPHGQKIRLAFLRLKSTAADPGPPIVYLAGGPGGSGIALAKGPRGSLFLRMREAGDVIVLDQRGVGLSEPRLDCPWLTQLSPGTSWRSGTAAETVRTGVACVCAFLA